MKVEKGFYKSRFFQVLNKGSSTLVSRPTAEQGRRIEDNNTALKQQQVATCVSLRAGDYIAVVFSAFFLKQNKHRLVSSRYSSDLQLLATSLVILGSVVRLYELLNHINCNADSQSHTSGTHTYILLCCSSPSNPSFSTIKASFTPTSDNIVSVAEKSRVLECPKLSMRTTPRQ